MMMVESQAAYDEWFAEQFKMQHPDAPAPAPKVAAN
jgi:hypothetical protein